MKLLSTREETTSLGICSISGRYLYLGEHKILDLEGKTAELARTEYELGEEEIAKRLKDNTDLQGYVDLEQDENDKKILKTHLKELSVDLTVSKKVFGTVLLTAVVIGFIAYNYLYQSMDKDHEEDDKK